MFDGRSNPVPDVAIVSTWNDSLLEVAQTDSYGLAEIMIATGGEVTALIESVPTPGWHPPWGDWPASRYAVTAPVGAGSLIRVRAPLQLKGEWKQFPIHVAPTKTFDYVFPWGCAPTFPFASYGTSLDINWFVHTACSQDDGGLAIGVFRYGYADPSADRSWGATVDIDVDTQTAPTIVLSTSWDLSPIDVAIIGFPPSAMTQVMAQYTFKTAPLFAWDSVTTSTSTTVSLVPVGRGLGDRLHIRSYMRRDDSGHTWRSIESRVPTTTDSAVLDAVTLPSSVTDCSASWSDSGRLTMQYTIGTDGAPADAMRMTAKWLGTDGLWRLWDILLPPESPGAGTFEVPLLPAEYGSFAVTGTAARVYVGLAEADFVTSFEEADELDEWQSPLTSGRVSRSWCADGITRPIRF